MQDRDEKVVQAWQRRLRRQEWISRLTVVVVLGLIATKVVAKVSTGRTAIPRSVSSVISRAPPRARSSS